MLLILGLCSQAAFAATTTIVSDGTTQWSADGISYVDASPCFAYSSWPAITGATWIWKNPLTVPLDEYNFWAANPNDQGWYFKKTITLPTSATNISGDIWITSDNSYKLLVNNNLVGQDGEMKFNPLIEDLSWQSVETYNTSDFSSGENDILIRAINYANWGDAYSNPAGLLYKAVINYDLGPGFYWLSPLDSTPTASFSGNTLNIGFINGPTFDKSVTIRVRNNSNNTLIAGFTYGSGITYNAAQEYHQTFDLQKYGIASGTQLKVMVYFGGVLKATKLVTVN